MPLKLHHVWSSDKISLSGYLGIKEKGQVTCTGSGCFDYWDWKGAIATRQHSWEANWESEPRAEAGEEMAPQPQQSDSIFIYYGFLTTAQDKLFEDFWELHSRFWWENTNILEMFLSMAGNVLLTYICLTVCECPAQNQTLLWTPPLQFHHRFWKQVLLRQWASTRKALLTLV